MEKKELTIHELCYLLTPTQVGVIYESLLLNQKDTSNKDVYGEALIALRKEISDDCGWEDYCMNHLRQCHEVALQIF